MFVPVECFYIGEDELYYLWNKEITKQNPITNEEKSVGIFDCDGFYLGDNNSIVEIEKYDKKIKEYRAELNEEDYGFDFFKPQWPLKRNAEYHLSGIDYYRSGSSHNGIDIPGDYGEYVYPVAEGIVEDKGYQSSMGNYVKIRHDYNGRSFYARYMHFSSIPSNIKKNATVTTDTIIGYMGSTGDSTGTHLHFDIATSSSASSYVRGRTFEYYMNNISALKNVGFYASWKNSNGANKSAYWQWILDNSTIVNGKYMLKSHTCGENGYETYGNTLGACKVCHKAYDYNAHLSYDSAGLYVVKNAYKNKKKITLKYAPYADAKTFRYGTSAELEISGYVKNAYNNKWYTLSGAPTYDGTLYVYGKDVDDCYDIHELYAKKYESGNYYVDKPTTINFTSMNSPSGALNYGNGFGLRGTISSNYNITSICGEIINATTKGTASSTTVYPNTGRYIIDTRAALNKNLIFNSLPVGTYYIKYTVTDTSGTGAQTWTSPNFNVLKKGTSIPSMPSVSISPIEGGQRATISTNSGLTLHCWSDVGEKSGSGSVTIDFNTPGSHVVDGWVSSGNIASAKNRQSVYVNKMSTPVISEAVYRDNNAMVTISGGGTIYYTTNGSNPNTNSTKYTGPIYITDSQTIKAISVRYGCVNSDVATKNITISKPSAPSVSLYSTKTKIAQGRTATVSWSRDECATNYSATLYKDENVVKKYDTTGTIASFVLPDAGVYTIRVTAANFKGSSGDSNAVSVESMAPVTVTFIDKIDRDSVVTDAKVKQIQERINEHDKENAYKVEGNIIAVQKVKYDTKPIKPLTPSKKGFTFSGWGDGLYTPATENKTIYACYEINYYTVDFYDTSTDDPHRLGNTQEIMYTDSAVAPTNYTPPAAYVFTGWNVDNAKSTGFDYKYVDGNMVLYTAYSWGNMDLPVFVQITSLTRKNNSYKIKLRIKNNPVDKTQGRIVAALYTADGRNVYTQISEDDLDLGKQNDWTDYPEITLLYSDKISYAKVFVVAANNDKTGGALSAAVTCDRITYAEETDSKFWTGWSEWSTTPITANDYRRVETKTQYSYRDKSTCTGNTPSKSGWTKYDQSSSTGGWSGWSNSAINPFENNSQKREVQTQWVKTSKQQWLYSRYYGWSNGSIRVCPYYSGVCVNYEDTGWLDYELPWERHSYFGGKGYSSFNPYWSSRAINDGIATRDRNWYNMKTRTVDDGYTQYRYRDTYYTYYFYKWSNWSSWSDSVYAKSSTRDVQTRTLYRYKTSSAIDGESEAETLYTYHESGVLNELSENFAGDVATVMIYKKTNTDPTQEQIEYIDQIIIGEGNTYEIKANTKEKLDYQKTGDFVVCLALEGGKKLVNVDLIKAPVPTYKVTFADGNGNELKVVNVEQGQGVDVNEIDIPVKDGYKFVKWNKSLVNITRNMIVEPVWEKNTYNIVFVDYENETTEIKEYSYGDLIVVAEPDAVEGKRFVGWDEVNSGKETMVTKNEIVTAIWESITFEVKFGDLDGNIINEQTVEYGNSALLPECISKDGVTYQWDINKNEWWNVTRDMVVYPYVPQEKALSSPTITPVDDTNGTFTTELFTSEDNAKVYYTIDESVTEEDVESYAEYLMTESGISEPEESQVQTALLSEENGNDNDDEYIDDSSDVLIKIKEYTEPINISSGSVVYAFTIDSNGNFSPISVFRYECGDVENDEGAVSWKCQ